MRRYVGYRGLIAASLIKISLAVPCAFAPALIRDTSPFPVWLNVANLMAFSLAAFLLIAGGRSDTRAQWLGATFLTFATVFSDRLLLRVSESGIGPLTFGSNLLVGTRVDALSPACLWIFARSFPEAGAVGAARFVPGFAIPIAFATGVVLFVLNLIVTWWGIGQMSVPVEMLPLLRQSHDDLYWMILILLVLPALAFMVLKQRAAHLEERRRVRLFVSSLFVGWTPLLGVALSEALVPPFSTWAAQHRGITGVIVYPPLLSLPFMTAYAVLVDRALDVQLVIRKALQHALARYATFAVLTIPFVGAVAYLYANRQLTVLDLVSGRNLLVLAATAACALAAARYGPPLFDAIDGLFFREQYDAHRTLADLIDSSRRATTTGELAELLGAQIDRALHIQTAAVFVVDIAAKRFVTPDGRRRPLMRTAALAVLLGGSPDTLDIHLGDPALRRLPEDEKQWLIDNDVQLLVPLLGVDGGLIGMIALGEKRSELPFSSEDRLLLRDVGGSAALALENILIRSSPTGTPGTSPLPPPRTDAQDIEQAEECVGCGEVHRAGLVACSSCGAELTRAAVPRVIGGKFTVMRRLGTGGMSIVYLARDLSLHRLVAVKTLPRVSLDHAARLRREARAMAAVSHLNLAQIFGLEAWHGTPMLIVEYLHGGTLADRVRHGSLPEEEVVAIGMALADGLERLHGSGILHRDVKPSNIGFTADNVPKLLDFGLAKLVGEPAIESAPAAGHTTMRRGLAAPITGSMQVLGTPAYMSPEALRGATPEPSFDLWALAIVLFESAAGRNPVRCESLFDMLDTIARADIPDIRTIAPGCSSRLATFFRDALHADSRRRPSSAAEFRFRLGQDVGMSRSNVVIE